jgi:hypothetical protein
MGQSLQQRDRHLQGPEQAQGFQQHQQQEEQVDIEQQQKRKGLQEEGEVVQWWSDWQEQGVRAAATFLKEVSRCDVYEEGWGVANEASVPSIKAAAIEESSMGPLAIRNEAAAQSMLPASAVATAVASACGNGHFVGPSGCLDIKGTALQQVDTAACSAQQEQHTEKQQERREQQEEREGERQDLDEDQQALQETDEQQLNDQLRNSGQYDVGSQKGRQIREGMVATEPLRTDGQIQADVGQEGEREQIDGVISRCGRHAAVHRPLQLDRFADWEGLADAYNDDVNVLDGMHEMSGWD